MKFPAVFALVVACSLSAFAEPIKASPRRMMFEFKLGPYLPLVDRGFPDKAGPYYLIFNNESMLLGEASLEYQFFQDFGTVSGGLGAGYAEKFAPALDDTGAQLSQKTGLKLMPFKAFLAYRFDWLANTYSVPLVPYAKAGIAAMYWQSVNAGGVELNKGDRGSGIKYGYFGTLGLALQIDFLDQRLARDFDADLGVNHSYLFAEYSLQEINDFHTQAATDLDFSSRHWMFGLALEF